MTACYVSSGTPNLISPQVFSATCRSETTINVYYSAPDISERSGPILKLFRWWRSSLTIALQPRRRATREDLWLGRRRAFVGCKRLLGDRLVRNAAFMSAREIV